MMREVVITELSEREFSDICHKAREAAGVNAGDLIPMSILKFQAALEKLLFLKGIEHEQ